MEIMTQWPMNSISKRMLSAASCQRHDIIFKIQKIFYTKTKIIFIFLKIIFVITPF